MGLSVAKNCLRPESAPLSRGVFFNSIKEIIRLRKEINRFLSKRMYIYLKVTVRKTDVLKTTIWYI